MQGVLVDERRINVDFSQSVAKQWSQHNKNRVRDAARNIMSEEQKQLQKQREQLYPQLRAKKHQTDQDHSDPEASQLYKQTKKEEVDDRANEKSRSSDRYKQRRDRSDRSDSRKERNRYRYDSKEKKVRKK